MSTERQFDSHYLEEHLDLDLKEQQRKITNKTNGYARIPTHEAALVDQCRCLKLFGHEKTGAKPTEEIMSDVGTEGKGIC